jgi:hypothetical protein
MPQQGFEVLPRSGWHRTGSLEAATL